MLTALRAPLHAACAAGALSVAQLLVRVGAAIDKSIKHGSTALHAACANGPARMRADVPPANEHTRCSWRAPARCGVCARPQAVALLLLSAGADANEADKEGSSPLHLAAALGHSRCVSLLLQNGAKVAHVDFGESALMPRATQARSTAWRFWRGRERASTTRRRASIPSHFTSRPSMGMRRALRRPRAPRSAGGGQRVVRRPSSSQLPTTMPTASMP